MFRTKQTAYQKEPLGLFAKNPQVYPKDSFPKCYGIVLTEVIEYTR